MDIVKVSEYVYEIPQTGDMNVPGRIFADESLIDAIISDNAPKQVRNVACLPGIEKYSFAMPDIHWGYGFPIGGVAAFDAVNGVISPGGVGYDINCGVRILTTCIPRDEFLKKRHDIISALFNRIPCGVGSKDSIRRPNKEDFRKLLTQGALWAAETGFEKGGDPLFCEEKGALKGADPDAASDYAHQRGISQVGTLGSGNHFLEIDEIAEIYDEKSAEVFGLVKGNIAIHVHTGSRGFGHQVCDDSIKSLMKTVQKYSLPLPDRQLVSAPLGSPEAKQYFAAMAAAANFAWANRQVIAHLSAEVFEKQFSSSVDELGIRLVYDVCHNIAKFEEHDTPEGKKKLCVHRKGATRALPPGAEELHELYKETGQPVLIPGDMGSSSYICRGTERAPELTFSSSCHGAGRMMSRKAAVKAGRNRNIFRELKDRGIELLAKNKKTASEEMPDAYKNATSVVNVMHEAGVVHRVARLKPLAVVKG